MPTIPMRLFRNSENIRRAGGCIKGCFYLIAVLCFAFSLLFFYFAAFT